VCRTNHDAVLRGQDGVVELVGRQLDDLVPVWVVLDCSHSKIVERDQHQYPWPAFSDLIAPSSGIHREDFQESAS